MIRLRVADRRLGAGLGLCLVVLGASIATAEPARPAPRSRSARDATVAAELFDLGRARLAAGDLVAACAAFTESQRLDPAVGTLLNLVVCLERRGRLDDALTTAREAAAAAAAAGDARVATAREWIARLEAAQVAQRPAPPVTAPPPPAPPPATAPAPAAEHHGAPAPAAPDTAATAALAAPASSHAGAPLVTHAATPPPPLHRDYRAPIALGLGAAAVLGGSLWLRLDAGDRQGMADELCPLEPCGPPAGRASDLSASAAHRSRLAVAGMIGGGVLATAAVGLWWRERRRTLPIVELGGTGAAVGLRGSF